MTAIEHDRLLAYVSHLPQLAASALMRVVGDEAGQTGLALTGRGLSDTTRLAASPADIWRDICSTNSDEIRRALDSLIAQLEVLREGLDDAKAIDDVFAAAAAWRAALPGKRRDP